MRGKLIVIDGADGSGKATQSKLLVKRLELEGRFVKTLDFPQYTENNFGRLLRECLDGKRGDFLKLDPKIASTLYAADRYESASTIRQWLEEGAIVVLDRYVSSNMLHQGGKINDENELHDFLEWLDTIEHSVFGIPRPDLILYLEVPYSFRQKMLFVDKTRTHLDVAETHESYNLSAEMNAKRLTAKLNNWKTIACTEKDTLLSKECIHELIHDAIQDVIKV